MNCLKCGRKLEDGQVFCTDCLFQMEKYPVKPGTAVILPSRDEPASARKAVFHFRPALSQEDHLRNLKRRVHRLTLALAILLLLFAGLAFYTGHLLRSQSRPRPGQNYSSVTTSESTGTN